MEYGTYREWAKAIVKKVGTHGASKLISNLKDLIAEEKYQIARVGEGIVGKAHPGRERFVYNNGYGLTTDMWLLPNGTKFRVVNGAWDGCIVEHGNVKWMVIGSTEETPMCARSLIREDTDCNLVIEIIEGDED